MRTSIYLEELLKLKKDSKEYDKNMLVVLNAIESKALQPDKGIFFDGQLFDAYVFALDLIKSA
jgi:hypothetical protein